MPIVKVNDVELYYELHGEGVPLLLITGWGLSAENWDPKLIKDLSEYYKVISIDNRGVGQSSKPDIEYSIKMMADDVKGLMDAIDEEKAHVLGFSMGGMIALDLALYYPETVKSLILCGAFCGGPSTKLTQDVWNMMKLFASGQPIEMPIEDLMKQFFSLVFTPKFLQENMEGLMTMFKAPPPMYVFQRQAQAIAAYNASERLNGVTAPTLVLTGEADVMVLPENSKVLADGIPNAQLKMFKETGHMFLWETKDQAAQVLLDFLSRIQ